jgi:hypothetical protein
VRKLPRYEARTGRGQNNYSLEREEDGPLCSAWDVEKLEAVVQAAQELIDQDVKVSRSDGGENRLGISLANLKRALEAL